MPTSFISTMSLLNTPRNAMARTQSEFVRLTKEITTGRMADVGLALGAETGRSVTLHVDTEALNALVNDNALATTRLEQTQSGLDRLLAGANDFLSQLLTAKGSDATPMEAGGRFALAGFLSTVNVSDGHGFLFAGINSAVPPIADYDAGPAAAVDAAFLARFGIAQDDPAVVAIPAADMADFIAVEFAQLFADPDWGTTWSAASDQPIVSRIAPSETVDTSVSANQPAMRKLAMVYTMVANLGIDGLNPLARQAVLDAAIGLVGDAVTDVIDVQAQVGVTQNRVTEATERLKVQLDILERRIATLEGVDPAEAKVRVDMLMTQTEMSYALTAKLLQMSILNYA